jgi:chloramphenicol-sensitive protein RarD
MHAAHAAGGDCKPARLPPWCAAMAVIEPPVPRSSAVASEAGKGVMLAIAAYGLWAFYGLFFKQFSAIDPLEVVAQRGFWSVPVAGVILFAMGRTGDIVRAFTTPRLMAMLFLSSLMVAISWGFFVWAIGVGRTLETSLGYFINPLLSVLIGAVLLGERLTLVQTCAVGLAAVAVVIQTLVVGVFPWLALTLAGSFAAYGYLRKTIDVGPVQGFFVEAVLLSVVGAGIMVWVSAQDRASFGGSGRDTFLLIACGPMTAAPLMLFAAAARRVRLATIGMLQYIAPTGLFLTAVFVFGEPLDAARLSSFALIWTALALYSFEAWRLDRQTRR